MHFINEDTFQNLFTFAPMFSLLILDSNRKIDWISTRISSEKINHLILTLNLVNDRVNFFKYSFSLYSNLTLNLYIVYELNNWQHNHTNNIPLKGCLFGVVKLVDKRNKK